MEIPKCETVEQLYKVLSSQSVKVDETEQRVQQTESARKTCTKEKGFGECYQCPQSFYRSGELCKPTKEEKQAISARYQEKQYFGYLCTKNKDLILTMIELVQKKT